MGQAFQLSFFPLVDSIGRIFVIAALRTSNNGSVGVATFSSGQKKHFVSKSVLYSGSAAAVGSVSLHLLRISFTLAGVCSFRAVSNNTQDARVSVLRSIFALALLAHVSISCPTLPPRSCLPVLPVPLHPHPPPVMLALFFQKKAK